MHIFSQYSHFLPIFSSNLSYTTLFVFLSNCFTSWCHSSVWLKRQTCLKPYTGLASSIMAVTTSQDEHTSTTTAYHRWGSFLLTANSLHENHDSVNSLTLSMIPGYLGRGTGGQCYWLALIKLYDDNQIRDDNNHYEWQSVIFVSIRSNNDI